MMLFNSIIFFYPFIFLKIMINEFEVYDLLNDDQKTIINEIIFDVVLKKYDIDINNFDYEIKGTII